MFALIIYLRCLPTYKKKYKIAKFILYFFQNFIDFSIVLQVAGRIQHFLQAPADRNAAAKQLGGTVPFVEFPEQYEVQRSGNVPE